MQSGASSPNYHFQSESSRPLPLNAATFGSPYIHQLTQAYQIPAEYPTAIYEHVQEVPSLVTQYNNFGLGPENSASYTSGLTYQVCNSFFTFERDYFFDFQ